MITVNDIREQNKKSAERRAREDAIEEKALGLMPDALLPDGVSCHSARADAIITYKVKTRQDAFDVFKKFDELGIKVIDPYRSKRSGCTSFGPKERLDEKLPEGAKVEMTLLAPLIWHGRAWGHGGKSTDLTFYVKIDDTLLEIRCDISQDAFDVRCSQEIKERRTSSDWSISGVPYCKDYLRTNYAGTGGGYDGGYTPGQVVVAFPYGCADLEEALGVK